MSEYLSELHACELSDMVWELDHPLIYKSDKFGLIEVPAGFQTDFASVPRLPIIYSMYGDRAHKSAVLHDYGYRTDTPQNLTFSQVNDLFFEAMICAGHKKRVAYPMYWGVVLGGYFSYHKRKVMDKL
jgi:hypothetical protein